VKTRVYLCVACYYLGFLGEGPCAAIFRILAYLAHGLPLSWNAMYNLMAPWALT